MFLGDNIDLTVRESNCRACRDGAWVVAFVLTALIAWRHWNGLLFFFPGVIGVYAAIAQISLSLIESELKRRSSEDSFNRLIALEIRQNRYRSRRNGALFLTFVLTTLIGWQGWNQLALVLPASIGLYAAIAQVKIRLIKGELERRTSEG